MLVRFWGTRGSIATPGPSTNRFGGNTSCVEVVTKTGYRFILDCGTGARELGAHLMAHEPKPIAATILLSHTHWDHIQGFPFFAPAFVPGNHITVCAPHGAGRSLQGVLAGQMEFTYFPVELGQLGAQIDYRDLVDGTFDLDGVRVTAQYLNHPAITLGYRIEADGISVLYLCDHEPYWEKLWRSDAEPGKLESILHAGDRRHADFMQNADVVIHDAQYTPEEYPAKKNWGHSTYSFVTGIAAAANVKRLFLTHHDPTHSDDVLSRIEERSREIAASLHSPIQVCCAYEGCEETFESDASHACSAPRREFSLDRPLRILVVDDDEDLRILARKALVRGGHEVMEATGGADALQLIERQPPDLVLLDLLMPPPDGFEILRILRSRESTRSLPVIVLTVMDDEESATASFELGATDYLNKPFTAPQLDARVRSCFVASRQ
jgi:CheY-like chemotaxis protein/phosphoribosyl 1,2-cyclic phosphodiesterase